MSRSWRHSLSTLGPAVAGVALALAAPVYGREGLALLVLAALAVAFPASTVGGFALAVGYGQLTAIAFARADSTGLAVAIACGALALAASLAPPRRWPRPVLAATLAAGGVATVLPFLTSYLAEAPISRAPGLYRWPLVVACFVAVVLFFTREAQARSGRRLAAVALVVAAGLGLWRLGDAHRAIEGAMQAGDVAALDAAEAKAARAGWSAGERRARLARARHELKAGGVARALALVPDSATLEPEARFVRAQGLLASGAADASMEEIHRALAADRQSVAGSLSDGVAARAGMWLLRWGDAGGASPLLARGASEADPAPFLAEAVAAARLRGAAEDARAALEALQARAPGTAFAACAAVGADADVERARACLERLPTHADALRALAGAGDAAAKAALEAGRELTAPAVNFAGVFQLDGARVGGRDVRRGASVHVALAAHALASCAPGEHYRVYIHLAGPDYRAATLPGGGRIDCVRGARFLADGEVAIPADLKPGPYRVLTGFENPESQQRLEAPALAGALAVEIGTLEVLP